MTRDLDILLQRAAARAKALSTAECAALLALDDPEDLRRLFDAAYAVKVAACGRTVALRGLVEAGNLCSKDCLYCGIRKSNARIKRYRLTADEILQAGEEAARARLGSLVIQSGEISSEAHTRFIEGVLRRLAPLNLGITLSLGEQEEETFRRWKKAGAARYLLRIETSNPGLYAALHPAHPNMARRLCCLRALRRTGYQVGTGVMCGLPGQTLEDLAQDIRLFGAIDADMIGMGPYIPHPDTPLGARRTIDPPQALLLGLKMIAVTRLYLHDVNIAASTALQALAPDGRARGVRAGANVIMPNLTAVAYRRQYQLYAGKPASDESNAAARTALEEELARIGETIAYGQRGDSRHFTRRTL